MPELSLFPILAAALILGIAAFTQGFSGFGFGILATAMLATVWPDVERASVLASLGAVIVQFTLIAVAQRDRHRIDWRAVGLLMTGTLVGIPLGYAFLVQGKSTPWFRVIFGWLRPRVRRPIPWGFAPLIGGVSGVISGAFSSGGPPLVLYIYAREHDPRMAKATLQAVFIASTVARLIVVQTGQYPITWPLLHWLVITAPLVVAFVLVGHWMSRKVTIRVFTWAVYAVIAAAGLMQIAKGVGSR
jgi:uncharacterized membrane protein YfcA